ncbi:hypothetical protein ASF60_16405 [Methylobacterium sp. Leaf113]|uniref:hypothetical protein n=1 Tax=unclassified Methylobacterium TaxID=2615210 RepID=UPI0006F76F68|nr:MULTISPECIES: hypothetical protein [unclassified Methylobacterium]KQP83029.1 hypothetical protein ASF57_13030 [Methylobacterium sp. Leaf117]KQP92700.1 hypothetical protein ASF60_16405 [Methylobacterium sp. Leaf113]
MTIPLPPRLIRIATTLFRRVTLGRVPRLFDAGYYRTQHPDVARSGIDPFLHYVWRGAAQNRDPSADFDTAFYKHQSGRIRLDPVRHYLRFGAKAGLDPNPNFSTLMYVARYPDIGAAGVNPLLHYRQDGRAEGRVAAPSASQPEEWVPFQGVREAHRWVYPAQGSSRFSVTLRRDVPATACPTALPRLCLVLTLDGAEIDGLVQSFDAFAHSAADAITLTVDTTLRPHPPRPTLVLALEHAFHGPGPGGTIQLRYAEARIWDVVPERPHVLRICPAGALSIQVL